MLWAGNLLAGNLTSMGEAPDWSRLDQYQAQVTASDFRWLLESQFAPNGAAEEFIEIQPDQVLIKREASDEDPIALKFRSFEETPPPAPRYWRTKAEWAAAQSQDAPPLAGLKIALDPGHLGGEFSAMEFRSWQAGDGPVFREGDFVLLVAQKLANRLEELGAEASLVRSTPGPVTTDTPESLRPLATKLVDQKEALTPGLAINLDDRQKQIDALARLLFYRVSEIHARAEIVNDQLQPDVTLCLHVDGATPPEGQDLVERGYAHYLVNGAYSASELAYDDQRLQMLEKLLSGAWREERGLAGKMSRNFAAANDLPPYVYTGSNAVRINEDPYLWARNLMANRLYHCPTVFLEPYVANSQSFYDRFVHDQEALSEEYVTAVINALLEYYAQ